MKKQKLFLGVLLFIILLAGCGNKESKEPITITIWHYYNGTQKSALDEMVLEFNDTIGREKGIIAEAYSKGNVDELEKSILSSIQKEPGSEKLPTIFASYADTAYMTEKLGYLADLDEYFTEEELSEYIPSYLEEGRIGENGELKIFPIAKSSEIFMMNKTDWDKFADETDVSIELLSTYEGITQAAKKYYEWTDAQTPEVLNDGKAFYGRDAVANLFFISSMQYGIEMFQVEKEHVNLNVDRNVMKKIWDNYYVPYISGYFYSYGKFRSDDVQMGKILAFTGSTSSAGYFPKEVIEGEDSYAIEALILPPPVFKGGQKYAVQQGAGMAVTKGTKEVEAAAAEFLKWFTQAEHNMMFAEISSYLPVKKQANKKEVLDSILEKRQEKPNPLIYQTLLTSFDMLEEFQLYTNKGFENGKDARKILEYNLQEKAERDREEVVNLLNDGFELEEAISEFIKEEHFEEWYQDFVSELKAIVQ